jgi:hypothetical protein
MAHTRTALNCTRCGAPTADLAAICGPCGTDGTRALASWAVWARNLDVTLTRWDKIRRTDGTHHTTDEQPLPFNVHASHIQGRARRTLTEWHRRLRTAIPLDHMLPAWPVCEAAATFWCTHETCRRIYLDYGNAPASLPDMALALAAAAPWWRHQADAADLIRAAERAVRDARAAADIPPPMIALGRCDSDGSTDGIDYADPCGAELRAPKGAAFYTCPACNTQYDVERRRARLLARLDALIQPGAVIVRVLSDWMGEELSLSTLRTWAQRKQIARRGRDRATGLPMYRFGDVRERFVRSINEKAKAEATAQHTDTKETLAA